jgi:hypothetical protein
MHRCTYKTAHVSKRPKLKTAQAQNDTLVYMFNYCIEFGVRIPKGAITTMRVITDMVF